MFGSKLKTWMENYIGRAKKKEVQKETPRQNEKRGIILESSESLAQSDTGISSSSQQVLSSSTIDNKEKYSTTTTESERSGMTHTHTAISLPSPESAYSTGYSTDGASPGPTGPPEYYINIRTGKHYFPSPVPTPTSPQPENAFLELHPGNQRLSTSFFPEDSNMPLRLAHISRIERELSSSSSSSSCAKSRVQTSSGHSNCFPSPMNSLNPKNSTLYVPTVGRFDASGHSKFLNKKSSTKSQLTSLKLFLKSPKREREKSKSDANKTPTPESKKKQIPNGKHKKWFKQPFQKFGHRKTDYSDERGLGSDAKRETHFEKNFCYLLSQENSASPRQRNRIKTNPWLPTEPLSSQNFHNLNFSPSLSRNRSCSNTPLQNRKASHPDPLQNRILQQNSKFEEARDYLDGLEKAFGRHLGEKPVVELSDHSEEDLTLNEMMGTYNESYVYEKETDILSDSDPTDCDDYGTDSEANNGGDERDSHDDELDFIDNGSVIESEDNFPRNTGKCTYYETHIKKNSFLYKSDRHQNRKGSECRKNSKKDQESKGRREKRRQPRKSFKREDEEAKVKKTQEEKVVQKIEIDENVGGLNLSRVLAHRLMAKKISKSAEGTPVTERRQKATREIQKSHIGNENVKPEVEVHERKPKILADLVLGDTEADFKYKELIKEAENIFESMRNSPVIKIKKGINLTNDEDKAWRRAERSTVSAEIVQNKETAGSFLYPGPKERKTPAKKSPRDLGLILSVEMPRKLKQLDFEMKNQTSFKGKPSAHSPLDPLGPSLRNFAIFEPNSSGERKISTSSSEDSEKDKAHGAKGRDRSWGDATGSHMVPIAFQSVDLGKPITSYCPQSEPVKRKIYTCSKTYDKLVKKFENKPTIFEENVNGDVGRISLVSNCRNNWTNSLRLEKRPNGNQGHPPREKERSGERLCHGEAFQCQPQNLRTSPFIRDLSRSEIPQMFPSPDASIFKRDAFILEKKRE